MSQYCVIGSLNMDLVATCEAFPGSGETVTGASYFNSLGGKGGNQTTALARLGGSVSMIGSVGKDSFGRDYLAALKAEGADTTGIGVDSSVSTGVALIEVEASGANRIIVVPGANGTLSKAWLDKSEALIARADYCLFQAEIPHNILFYALKKAKALGSRTIFDPAPAVQFEDSLYRLVDCITPNEYETEKLTGIYPSSPEKASEAARFFFDKGISSVVVKMGGEGAAYFDRQKAFFCPALEGLKPLDTTAAGDTFNAAFALALGRGFGPGEALKYANTAAGLSITRMGAQPSIPRSEEAESLFRRTEVSPKAL